jgi:hypothetical protein
MNPSIGREFSLLACLSLLVVSACGQQLDVGSDLLWTSRFESGIFDEWTSLPGGSTWTSSPANFIATSGEHVHAGSYAAKLTITTPSDGSRAISSLMREGGLPDEAYYSAWYYLPQKESVGAYWVLMKFRRRTNVTDANTVAELFDIDLKSLSSGEMALRIYDHTLPGDAAMLVVDPVVPVGNWFQLEAFYRNASDATGRLTLWLDGKLIADVVKATGTPGWVAWELSNIGESLTPQTVSLYVDDCAISRMRVGPAGHLAM